MASGAASACNAEPTEIPQKMQSLKVKIDDSSRTGQQGTIVEIASPVKMKQSDKRNKGDLAGEGGRRRGAVSEKGWSDLPGGRHAGQS